MKCRLLEVLACPDSASDFTVFSLNEKISPINNAVERNQPLCQSSCPWGTYFNGVYQQSVSCYTHDIISGVLYCVDNHIYPIVNGIPRLFSKSDNKYFSYIQKHQDELPESLS